MKKRDLQEAAGLTKYAMNKLSRDEMSALKCWENLLCFELYNWRYYGVCFWRKVSPFYGTLVVCIMIGGSTLPLEKEKGWGHRMNKQQLAQKIWASANQMRSKIEANEYKDYILGFIFTSIFPIRKLSSWRRTTMIMNSWKPYRRKMPKQLNGSKNIGYFIAYKDLFSTWLTMGKDFDVSNVRDALSAFSRLISSSHKGYLKKYLIPCKQAFPNLAIAPVHKRKQLVGCWRW